MREVLMSFDSIGSTLIFAAVLCFFMAIQWGGVVYPWNSSTEIGLLVGCFLLSIVFALNEWYQGDRALVVYRLLRRRSIGASAGFIFFLNAGNIALQYQLPIYFQAIQGDSPVQSRLKMIPSILGTALATAAGSTLAGRLQMFQPFLLGGGAIATIGCGLIFTFGINEGLGAIIGYQILYGVGTGLGVQIPNLVATVTTAAENVSTAVSSVAFFMMLAGGWGVAATDAILNNFIVQRIPRYVPGLDAHAVLNVGTGAIKDTYSGQVPLGVREAYLDGLHAGWALGIAAFGMAFVYTLLPSGQGS